MKKQSTETKTQKSTAEALKYLGAITEGLKISKNDDGTFNIAFPTLSNLTLDDAAYLNNLFHDHLLKNHS